MHFAGIPIYMTCQICRRESSGLGWYDPDHRPRASVIYKACSPGCLNTIIDTKGQYVHTSKNETLAIEAGGQAGGEYLDSIGEYSLDKLSKAQYDEYCSRVFISACEKLQELAASDVVAPY